MSAKQDSVKKTLKSLIPCPLGCKLLTFAISGVHLGYHLDYIKILKLRFSEEKHFRIYRCKILIFAISGFHLGYHLEYIKMLNDAKVASLVFFKGKAC